MFAISIAQLRIRPFKLDVISDLEHREMVASLLTLYGGVIFSQKENPIETLNVIFFILILIVNSRFLILWTFCVTSIYRRIAAIGFINLWIKKSFWLEVKKEDEEVFSCKSKTTIVEPEKRKKKFRRTRAINQTTLGMKTTAQNLVPNNTLSIPKDKKSFIKVETNEEDFSSARTPKGLMGGPIPTKNSAPKRNNSRKKKGLKRRRKKKKVKNKMRMDEDPKIENNERKVRFLSILNTKMPKSSFSEDIVVIEEAKEENEDTNDQDNNPMRSDMSSFYFKSKKHKETKAKKGLQRSIFPSIFDPPKIKVLDESSVSDEVDDLLD